MRTREAVARQSTMAGLGTNEIGTEAVPEDCKVNGQAMDSGEDGRGLGAKQGSARSRW